MKETRLAERLALAQGEQNNNMEEEEVNKTGLEGVRTLESEPGWTMPGPFEPAPEPRKSPTGVEKRVVMFPAMDVRKSRREERLKRKAETKDRIARMVTDSAMKIEIAMEHDRNGKTFISKQGQIMQRLLGYLK